MYGSLLERRNLLLVDQRGTGRSEPINCPQLQDLKIAYADAAAACGARLGERADDYTTALSADDLAAVIEALELTKVDVYGDSYGTFFAQVFVGRHPELVRTVVLDASYPTYGETGWYPTQGPAVRRAFDVVCDRFAPAGRRDRFPAEAAPGAGGGTGAAVARAGLRRRRRRTAVTVDAPALLMVAYGATYTPAFYRELTAALRSGLAGDRAPLRRLVAEATGGNTDAGPVAEYSEGLYAAVACHDYPQLYDMTAPPACGASSTPPRCRAAGLAPRDVRAVHRGGVRGVGLAGARLVHRLARRAGGQPGRSAGTSLGQLPRRSGAGARR